MNKILAVLIGLMFAAVPSFIAGLMGGALFHSWWVGLGTGAVVFGISIDILFFAKDHYEES